MSNQKSAEASDCEGMESTTQTRVSVPVASIHVDPANNLRMFPAGDKEIAALKASIQEQGLVNPLVVRHAREEDGLALGLSYVLEAGFQRMAAIQALGWSAVDVTITDGVDGHLLNIDENVVRNTLSPMDEAFVCQKLKDAGMKGVDIAKRMHQSSAWVTGRLKLMGLRPAIQAMVHSGKLDATFAARDLAMNTEEEQDKILAGLAAGGEQAKAVRKAAKVTKKVARKAKAKAEGKKLLGRKAKVKKKKPVHVTGAKSAAGLANGHTGAVIQGALGLYPTEQWTLTPKEVLAVKVLTAVSKAKSPKAAWDGVVKAL